jgi:hypothetical protein
VGDPLLAATPFCIFGVVPDVPRRARAVARECSLNVDPAAMLGGRLRAAHGEGFVLQARADLCLPIAPGKTRAVLLAEEGISVAGIRRIIALEDRLAN